ncbi:MAG: hypothetical protein GY778_18830 [bacterium]|nr:hypothetical protein [bacterium]
MPPPRQSRLIAWYLLLKDEWIPAQWRGLSAWGQAAREEPRLIWETPQVRYAVYGIGVLIGVGVLVWLASALGPPQKDVQPRAKTADFHVICLDDDCGHHFLINRKFGFDRFPVTCPRCEGQTGHRAQRCHSRACAGRYVAPIESDGEFICASCGADLGRAP